MTPNNQVVYDYVKQKYGSSIGVWNCRRISGSLTWSQHSWGNASDIYTEDKALQDSIKADLFAQFSPHIRNILTWRYNAAHWNHLHVDMWPKGWRKPPCKGADLRVKHRNGDIGTVFTSDLGDDELSILTDAEQVQLQKFLAELNGVGSSVSFVKYLIPWYRQWRNKYPSDFAAAGSDVSAHDAEAHARLDELHNI